MSATIESHRRLLMVEPQLSRIAPLRTLVPCEEERTLYHAGPPFADPAALPLPVFNSVIAAACQEGWATNAQSTLAMLADGALRLLPAQDIGLVTPLAFVVGPQTPCLQVNDARDPGPSRLAPLNDGPLPDALRFGSNRIAGRALLGELVDHLGQQFADSVIAPIPLLPLMAEALQQGDDLHGRVEAAQRLLCATLLPVLPAPAKAYLESCGQFVLNILMAAAALMLAAGAGIPGSRMVVACGGNGRELGYQLAGDPGHWHTVPALPPQGPRLPGAERAMALPAIGDSAVLDATGFGAACLRFAPELLTSLGDAIDPVYASDAAHAPFIGAHPALPLPGLRVGLDFDAPYEARGIMLATLDANGEQGLIGRGVAPWQSP